MTGAVVSGSRLRIPLKNGAFRAPSLVIATDPSKRDEGSNLSFSARLLRAMRSDGALAMTIRSGPSMGRI